MTPDEWRPDPVPYQLQFIWTWFLDLHSARYYGPKGRPLPISYQDMVSWSTLTERKLGPFEIKVIRQLDERYFYVLNNPTAAGPRPKGVTQEHVENDVAGFLRAMRSMKDPGLQELPVAKKQVPSLNFKDGK